MTLKKILTIVGLSLIPLAVFYFLILVIIVVLSAGVATQGCTATPKQEVANTSENVSSTSSIDEFVKTYQDSYIEAWGIGGFLPSASIVQTMAETSFNMSVPSFGQAHNMGGVKWSGPQSFPKTIEMFGPNAVSNNGAGTDVGDGTGGSYTYFISFEAGIVGKAEFMSRQSLYTGAINNEDGVAALNAIADGGWATDPNYKVFLQSLYSSLGQKFKWLDDLAIEKYGTNPVSTLDNSITNALTGEGESSGDAVKISNGCSASGESSGTAADGTGTVPSDVVVGRAYKPSEVPASLKEYIIDPESLGLSYGSSGGWANHTSEYLAGQCVALTISLGNQIWGHQGLVYGNGIDQASAWANIFSNSTKPTPIKGAIFSHSGVIMDGEDVGHTGIVCHVFENGQILIVEQNTEASGIDFYGQSWTWNYRVVSVEKQQSANYVFAYSESTSPKFGN
ncbi:CHAP domain-containing protein [Streptococcus suis]|nr:CHAP domain-containing protein [Streptococcus suis]